MDSVYDYGQRTWVSEVICLKDYFSRFLSVLPPEIDGKETGKTEKIRERELKVKISKLMNVKLSDGEINILSETCSLDKLTVDDESPTVDVKCIKTRPGLFDKSKIPASAMELETMKHLKKRILNEEAVQNLKYRSSIWPSMEPNEKSDLEVGKHILIMVRIYHPFRHRLGERNMHPPRCSQEMVVLGHQTISLLREKIVCPTDLCVSVEVSDNPDQEFRERAKDVYKSGLIFIENTFYNDFRNPENIDYSRVIRKWAHEHDLGPFKTEKMEEFKFEDLSFRLGYPYVYQHQGNCEHLIVFSDVRLLHKNDNLTSLNYPLIRSMSTSNAQYCMICGIYIASFEEDHSKMEKLLAVAVSIQQQRLAEHLLLKRASEAMTSYMSVLFEKSAGMWITCENERVPHDPCYFCDHCFQSYNYSEGKKIGNFKAYPFFGKP